MLEIYDILCLLLASRYPLIIPEIFEKYIKGIHKIKG